MSRSSTPVDHADNVICRDGKPEAVTLLVHKVLDLPLASLVKLFGLEVEALDLASQRIAKKLHFRLPAGFTPSALRKAR
jgi:hypothetical protein